jgi:hypothetical protein
MDPLFLQGYRIWLEYLSKGGGIISDGGWVEKLESTRVDQGDVVLTRAKISLQYGLGSESVSESSSWMAIAET